MNKVFSKKDVEDALSFARQDPEGFIKATARYSKSVSVEQVKRSLTAWEIPFEEEADANYSSHGTTWGRQDNRH